MRQRRSCFSVVLITAICMSLITAPAIAGDSFSFTGQVTGTTSGELLFKNIVQQFAPDSIKMIIDQTPDASGKIRHMYFEAKGAHSKGFRIDSITGELTFAQFNPSSEWTSKLELKEVVSGSFLAMVTEADLNKSLADMTLNGGDGSWKKVSVDFRKGGIYARGYFESSDAGVSALIELETTLKLKGGNQIWLGDYTIKVNTAEKPDSMIADAIEKLQPLLDFRDFLFPVKLSGLQVGSSTITISTRTPPKPFDGIVYTYSAK